MRYQRLDTKQGEEMVQHTSRPMLLALINPIFILRRRRAFNTLTVDEIILRKSVRSRSTKKVSSTPPPPCVYIYDWGTHPIERIILFSSIEVTIGTLQEINKYSGDILWSWGSERTTSLKWVQKIASLTSTVAGALCVSAIADSYISVVWRKKDDQGKDLWQGRLWEKGTVEGSRFIWVGKFAWLWGNCGVNGG